MDSNTYMNKQNNKQNNKYREECIICFDTHHVKTPLYFLKDMPGIIKTCDCQYKCHVPCFYEWLKNNSRCLLCNKDIIMMPSILNKHITQISPFHNFNNLGLSVPLIPPSADNTQIHYSPPPPYTIALNYKKPEITLTSGTPENNIILINDTEDRDTDEYDIDEYDIDEYDTDEYDTKGDAEVIDGGSFKCCCTILTLITLGFVIEHIF